MYVNCPFSRVTCPHGQPGAVDIDVGPVTDQQKILKNVVFNLLYELCEWVSLKIRRKHSLVNVVAFKTTCFALFDLVNTTVLFDKRQRILSPIFFNTYRHYVSEIHLPSLWVLSHLVQQLTRKISFNFPCFLLTVVEPEVAWSCMTSMVILWVRLPN